MLVEDKVAIVTGAARGIGNAIARVLHEHGATVVLADLDGDGAASAAAALGERAAGEGCDVADETAVEDLVQGAVHRHGRVDILVNNAGITRDAMMHKMALAQFREVIDVHLQGAWLCSRAVLRHMRQGARGGAIVNISSVSGKAGNLGQTNYSAAKAGMIGLTKATAREGARFGIRVNAIMPGVIRTPMIDEMPPEALAEKVADIPLGRMGEPVDVANVALFLASDLAAYVTGTTIEVAGGRHM